MRGMFPAMATLNDDGVRALLSAPNCAVISTHNADGSILSTVVWISLEDGELAVNSAEGRRWPTNLERDPHITALVYPADNPYEYVEIEGTATRAEQDAVAHIDRLAQKYTGEKTFAGRPGDVRVKYVIAPTRVRYDKQ
jgi:PPOX class probable F420-dependent enzyme